MSALCVQLTEGNDDLLKRQRRLQLRLCLACWNPGEHGGEVLHPRKNEAALGGYSYYRLTGKAAQTYTRNMEGEGIGARTFGGSRSFPGV